MALRVICAEGKEVLEQSLFLIQLMFLEHLLCAALGELETTAGAVTAFSSSSGVNNDARNYNSPGPVLQGAGGGEPKAEGSEAEPRAGQSLLTSLLSCS